MLQKCASTPILNAVFQSVGVVLCCEKRAFICKGPVSVNIVLQLSKDKLAIKIILNKNIPVRGSVCLAVLYFTHRVKWKAFILKNL